MDLASYQSLIENLNNYLVSAIQPTSWWKYVLEYLPSVVTMLSVLVGGGFALYKYIQARNYEVNLKILNEVYLPLYSYLVKQECFRYICGGLSYEEVPIFEIKSTHKTVNFKMENGTGKVSQHEETNPVLDMSTETLLEVCDSTNLGLAPTKLSTLLNAYRMLHYISSGNQVTRPRAKATLLKIQVERELCEEIIRGYNYYHKKLGLSDSDSLIFKIEENRIKFADNITDAQVDEEMKLLENAKQQ